jgi:hypothetical protein
VFTPDSEPLPQQGNRQDDEERKTVSHLQVHFWHGGTEEPPASREGELS